VSIWFPSKILIKTHVRSICACVRERERKRKLINLRIYLFIHEMIWKINFQMFATYSKLDNEPWRTILTCLSPFDTYVNGCKKNAFILRVLYFFVFFVWLYLDSPSNSHTSHVFFSSLELTRRSFSSTYHILGSLSFLIYWTRTIKKNKRNQFNQSFCLVLFYFNIFTTIFSYTSNRIILFHNLKESCKQPWILYNRLIYQLSISLYTRSQNLLGQNNNIIPF